MSTNDPAEPNPPAVDYAETLMPVGVWLRLDLPNHPGIVGYTYVDPDAGFSAQGWKQVGDTIDQSSRIIIRLTKAAVPWRQLLPDEIRSLGLEGQASWVTNYGPQPAAGTLWGVWREHPKLKGRFSADVADDLQVIVHDGGPRMTANPPEAVWVSVRGVEGDLFRGTVLNQPHNLKSVSKGSEIKFMVADGSEYPVMVTDKYLAERGVWIIHPCQQCGFSELFDAPSDLSRVVFPNTPPGAIVSMFTAFCPLCRGVQVVEYREDKEPFAEAEGPSADVAAIKRPWWKFWG